MNNLPQFTDYDYLAGRVDAVDARLAEVAELLWDHVQGCRAGDTCPACRAFVLATSPPAIAEQHPSGPVIEGQATKLEVPPASMPCYLVPGDRLAAARAGRIFAGNASAGDKTLADWLLRVGSAVGVQWAHALLHEATRMPPWFQGFIAGTLTRCEDTTAKTGHAS